MTRLATMAAFFGSAVFAPWALTVMIGVALIAVWHSRFSVIFGGVLMDSLFGVPIPALGGFAWVYTALFVLLVGIDSVVRTRMID